MLILDEMKRLQMMHQLIITKNTGTPDEFASKLCVSRRQLYRLLVELEELGASVSYSRTSRTFLYIKHFKLNFIMEINGIEYVSINGGFRNSPAFFSHSVPNYDTESKKSFIYLHNR